ncbi:hypothetical protein FRC18_006399 [Serendipita sp. 400]|nr:hypothetical protein FRC18_006399 [Serendipita sp. 400]
MSDKMDVDDIVMTTDPPTTQQAGTPVPSVVPSIPSTSSSKPSGISSLTWSTPSMPSILSSVIPSTQSSIPSSTSTMVSSSLSSSSLSSSSLPSTSLPSSSGTGSPEYTFTDYIDEYVKSGALKDITVQKIDDASEALVKRATGKQTRSAVLDAVDIYGVITNRGVTVVEENNRIRYITVCDIITREGHFKTITVNKPPGSDAYFRIPRSPRLGTTVSLTKAPAATNKDHGFKAMNESALIWPVWQDPSKKPSFVMAYYFNHGVPKVDHFTVPHTFKGGYGDDALQTVDFAWRLTQYCAYDPVKPDHVGEERFIFVGYTKDTKTKHDLQGCYMRLVDLQMRLGERDEKRSLNDLDLLRGGKALYPLWKPDGTLLTGSQLSTRFNKMEPKLDDPMVMERHLFFEHCKVAHVARISEGLYDVLSRFWDGHWEPEFILQIDPSYKQKIMSTVVNDAGLMDRIEKIKEFWLFAPKIKEIVWGKPSGTGLIEWGRHPTSLYTLWMDSTAYSAVENSTTPGVWLPPRTEPSLTQLAAGNKKIETGILSTGSGTYVAASAATMTTTLVTRSSISIVRNFKRTPDQIGAMGRVSPNELVRTWWSVPDGDKVAEWLHRSAWSYGGLATGGKMDPQTSQTMSNLIIGTHETNTMMIRYEIFVKRLAYYTNLPVKVVTNILEKDLTARPTYAWCCPRLHYAAETSGTSAFPVKFSVVFEPFSRRLPTRFELDLDELFESLAYGWDDSSFMAQQ